MHPTNRAERRAQRERVIAKRKFIYEHIWIANRYGQPFTEWGRYAKFNLNCGCRGCHYYKYHSEKRKRRRALDAAILDNLKSFNG